MPQCYLGQRIKQIYLGEDIKRAYVGSELFFSRSQKVTYYVDTNKTYEDEIDYGEPCFASASNNFKPNKFTPTKEGYTFVGWVENINDVPNADNVTIENVKTNYVLQEKLIGEEPINLYAVFAKSVTATFKRYYSTKPETKVVKYLYYNNDNKSKPTFYAPATVNEGDGTNYNDWFWRGWSNNNDTKPNAQKFYDNNEHRYIGKMDSDAIFYGLYEKTVTLSYNGNGGTGSTPSKNGTIYCNAYDTNNVLGATLTLETNRFAKTAYSFSKWALEKVSGTQYSAGTSVTIKKNTTCYAIWTANSSYDMLGSSSSPTQLIDWGNGGAKYNKDIATIDLSGYSQIVLGAYYQKGSQGLTPYCDLYVDGVKVITGKDSSTSDWIATSPQTWTITSGYKKTCTLTLTAGNVNNENAVSAYVQLIK